MAFASYCLPVGWAVPLYCLPFGGPSILLLAYWWPFQFTACPSNLLLAYRWPFQVTARTLVALPDYCSPVGDPSSSRLLLACWLPCLARHCCYRWNLT